MSTSPASAKAPAPAKEKLDPALVKLIIVMLTGVIPALLDTSIVNVAIDTIGRDLHTTVSTIQWVITGYLLSFGMVIPLSGWALARFGGRAIWVFSLSVFLLGSVLSGASWSIGSLIGFRILQGIGGGLLLPLLTTLLTQAAGGRNLGKLMATVSLPVAVVPILGPLVAGLIISNFSWRWIFFVNVPICLAGLILSWRGLAGVSPPQGSASADGAPRARARLDLVGLLLLCPALAGLLYGLAQVSTQHGFGHSAVLIPLGAGAVLLAGFIAHALRTSHEPLVDLRLFRSRSFGAASGLMFLAGLSIYGAMLLLPLYFQQARGYSALAAGVMMIPQGVGSILPRTLVGRLTDSMGPRPIVIGGTVLAALGTIPFAFAGPHANVVLLGAALFVRGAGLGAATIAVMAGAFSGLSKPQIPHASSMVRLMQQVGGAFGAAVLAVILASQVTAHAATAGGVATAFGHTFWWCVGFTVLALVPALLMPGRTTPAVATPAGATPAGATPAASTPAGAAAPARTASGHASGAAPTR
jgi:EmrB/QacA subfamily drug resistance transporter